MENLNYSIYNSGDVLDALHDNLSIHYREAYSTSLDFDNNGGEIILTMPDGSQWVVTAKKLED